MSNLVQENNQGFNASNFVNVPIEYTTNMVSNLKHRAIETLDSSGMCGGAREGTKTLNAKVPKWNRNKCPKIQIQNPKSTTVEAVDQPRRAQ